MIYKILPLIHLVTCFIYVILAVFIISKNPKSRLNQSSFLVLVFFAMWSFSMVFINNIYTSNKVAVFFSKITAIGWIGFTSAFMLFNLVYTEQKKLLKNKGFMAILVIIPLVLIIAEWSNNLIIEFIQKPYGWLGIFSKSAWTYLYYTYILVFIGFSIVLISKYGHKSDSLVKKREAGIFVITILISLVVGYTINIILRLMKIHSFPPIADITSLLWAGGMVFAIVRYELFTLSPDKVAKEIIQTMPDSLLLIDEETRILEVNGTLTRLLDYNREELLKKSIFKVFNKEDATRFQNNVLDNVMQQNRIINYETFLLTKNNEKIPALVSSTVLRDKKNNLRGIICIATDMRETRSLVNDLEKSRKQIEEKAKDLENFIYAITHDLKAPLDNINAYIGTIYAKIKDKISKDDFYYIKGLEVNVNRISKLIKDLHELYKINKYFMQKNVDLEESLDGLEKEFKIRLSNKNIDFKVIKPLPVITCDRVRIEQVFANLISNAIQYMGKQQNPCIEIGGKGLNENKWQFYVRDNGIGVDSEYHTTIFKIFERLKEIEAEGSGIGLSIVKKIIEAHGGAIWIESEKGKGSTFFFTVSKILKID